MKRYAEKERFNREDYTEITDPLRATHEIQRVLELLRGNIHSLRPFPPIADNIEYELDYIQALTEDIANGIMRETTERCNQSRDEVGFILTTLLDYTIKKEK